MFTVDALQQVKEVMRDFLDTGFSGVLKKPQNEDALAHALDARRVLPTKAASSYEKKRRKNLSDEEESDSPEAKPSKRRKFKRKSAESDEENVSASATRRRRKRNSEEEFNGGEAGRKRGLELESGSLVDSTTSEKTQNTAEENSPKRALEKTPSMEEGLENPSAMPGVLDDDAAIERAMKDPNLEDPEPLLEALQHRLLLAPRRDLEQNGRTTGTGHESAREGSSAASSSDEATRGAPPIADKKGGRQLELLVDETASSEDSSLVITGENQFPIVEAGLKAGLGTMPLNSKKNGALMALQTLNGDDLKAERLSVWIKHQLLVGFDRVLVLYAGQNCGPGPARMIADLQKLHKRSEQVDFVPIPCKTAKKAGDVDHVGSYPKERIVQLKAIWAYAKLHEFAWVGVGDADEFLWLDSAEHPRGLGDLLAKNAEENIGLINLWVTQMNLHDCDADLVLGARSVEVLHSEKQANTKVALEDYKTLLQAPYRLPRCRKGKNSRTYHALKDSSNGDEEKNSEEESPLVCQLMKNKQISRVAALFNLEEAPHMAEKKFIGEKWETLEMSIDKATFREWRGFLHVSELCTKGYHRAEGAAEEALGLKYLKVPTAEIQHAKHGNHGREFDGLRGVLLHPKMRCPVSGGTREVGEKTEVVTSRRERRRRAEEETSGDTYACSRAELQDKVKTVRFEREAGLEAFVLNLFRARRAPPPGRP